MTEKELIHLLLKSIKKKIEKHKGISVFAKQRSKFEGWLKVELIDTLVNNKYIDAIPEKDRVDIAFKDHLIELKTANTPYGNKSVNKKRNILKKNIKGIEKDIKKLKNKKFHEKFKYVFFVVFPFEDNKKWKIYKSKIKNKLKDKKLIERGFYFQKEIPRNKIRGRIYLGRI